MLRNLEDGRKNPTYQTNKEILPVLFAFILRIRSFNKFNNMIKNKDFKRFQGRHVNYHSLVALSTVGNAEIKLVVDFE